MALFFVLTIALYFAAAVDGLVCQVGQKYTTSDGSNEPPNTLQPQTCASGYECLVIDATVGYTWRPSWSMQVKAGRCVSKAECPLTTCDQFKTGFFSTAGHGATVSYCCVGCCSHDNCNAASAQSINPSCFSGSTSIDASLSESIDASPTELIDVTSTEQTGPGMSCKVGKEFSSSNPLARRLLPSTSLQSQSCNPGEICSILDATIRSSNAYASVSIDLRVGQCLPSSTCQQLTCDAVESEVASELRTMGGNAHISSCCAACCDSTNCNQASAKSINPQCNMPGSDTASIGSAQDYSRDVMKARYGTDPDDEDDDENDGGGGGASSVTPMCLLLVSSTIIGWLGGSSYRQ